MRKNKIGEMILNSTVDITDPCYDKDVWCRINDLDIADGKYDCIVWQKNEGSHMVNGKVGIYKDGEIPQKSEMMLIGEIGVDAGMVGFFEDKPDYSEKEWREFCEYVDENPTECNAWIDENGFFADTAYGDGCYEVYAHYNYDGIADAIEIQTI